MDGPAADKNDAVGVTVLVIFVILFVVLMSCGCYYGSRRVLFTSCGYNSGGASEYAAAWDEMHGSSAHCGEELHAAEAAYVQQHGHQKEEYSTLRHPIGALQPVTARHRGPHTAGTDKKYRRKPAIWGNYAAKNPRWKGSGGRKGRMRHWRTGQIGTGRGRM